MDHQAVSARRLARLVREYGERAFRCAWRLTGNAEEARDLVQEAYRRVLDRWDRYDSSLPLENWFFTILRHLFLDAARRRGRRREVSLEALLDGEEDGSFRVGDRISDSEEGLLRALERRETQVSVRRALDMLRHEHRAVLVLCDMEGMRYEDIARVLGCPVGTVRSRISRARTALKRSLAAEFERSEGSMRKAGAAA